MLSPSIALLISIATVLILIRFKIHPGYAIFGGSLTLSFLTFPINSVPSFMFRYLIDYQTLRLLVIIASALILSSLMEEKGLLAKMATTLESIGPKLALHLIPAVIGLVPMPAGALVSATASKGLVEKLDLTAEKSTFINYWFRHIWEYSLPVYPAIIITSVLLSVPLSSVIGTLFPMSILAILSGAVLSYGLLKKAPEIRGEPITNLASNLLKASWPILLLVSIILLRLEAMIAFPLVLTILAIQQRVKWPELKKALKYGLNPTILFLLYAVMLYKAVIENSGAANWLLSDMQNINLPVLVILVALPLLMGLSTGFSMAFVGVALPLLLPYIMLDSGINGAALLLAYVSGFVGVLLSPVHLCLVLSAQYFGANLIRVYKYILPPSIVMEVVSIMIYYLAN